MTDNQKRELRTSFYKMMIFFTVFYGGFIGIILLDDENKYPFIWLVMFGYVGSLIMLLYQIVKTYKK